MYSNAIPTNVLMPRNSTVNSARMMPKNWSDSKNVFIG
jgi:hypothetical protein